MPKLTAAQIKMLLETAKAEDRKKANPFELSPHQARLVAAFGRLNRSGKASTVADALTDIIERFQEPLDVQQARNAVTVLVRAGLLTGAPVEKSAGTPGKAPQSYTVTDEGYRALDAKASEIIDLARELDLAEALKRLA